MVLDGLGARVAGLWDDSVVLVRAMRDDRVPWPPKAVAGMAALYGVSPVDLIPDLLLGAGLVDDAILVPAGLALAIRLIPADLRRELREQARRDRIFWRRVGLVVLAVLVALIVAAIWLWWAG